MTSQQELINLFDTKLIQSQILSEFVLDIDTFKTESARHAIQILDFFGDIGGFEQAIHILFGLFGSYFSSKFFIATLSSALYRRKKNKSELDGVSSGPGGGKKYREDEILTNPGNLGTQLRKLTEPVKISDSRILLDSLINTITCCFSGFLRHSGPVRRERIIEKCDEKFTDAVEVTNLINRVNMPYQVMKNIQDQKLHDILKYSKQRLVHLTSSEESNHFNSSSGSSEFEYTDTRNKDQLAAILKNEHNSEVRAQIENEIKGLQQAISVSLLKNTALSDEFKDYLYHKSKWVSFKHKIHHEMNEKHGPIIDGLVDPP